MANRLVLYFPVYTCFWNLATLAVRHDLDEGGEDSLTTLATFEDVPHDSQEMEFLRRVMSVTNYSNELGKGWDVAKKRRRYNSLRLEAAWRVVDTPVLHKYIKEKDRLNQEYAEHGRKFWVPTYHDRLQRELHEAGYLSENEYWLLQGCKPEYLHSMLSQVQAKRKTHADNSVFGQGRYFADLAEKADQYVQGADSNLAEISKLVGDENQHLSMLRSKLGSTEMFILSVFRVFLGRHEEMGRDLMCPDKGSGLHQCESRWFYVDPLSRKMTEIDDTIDESTLEHSFDGSLPNFLTAEPDGPVDSVKAMGRRYQPEFLRNVEWKGYRIPNRHDEYLIPKEIESDDHPRFALAYLLAYTRQCIDCTEPMS